MILSIIVEDKAAYKDRKSFFGLDMSDVPTGVRALQFDDVANKGHIEFYTTPNEEITSLPNWALAIFDAYEDAIAAYAAEQAALLAAARPKVQ